MLNRHGDLVVTHFAGPTWQGIDGSAVVGAFSTITYTYRLNTAGGIAPQTGCDADHAGSETRQPYEANYAYFSPTIPTATPTT